VCVNQTFFDYVKETLAVIAGGYLAEDPVAPKEDLGVLIEGWQVGFMDDYAGDCF
jgi:hypothetical protein